MARGSVVSTRDDALALLLELSAPARLVRHVELVEEAGERLLARLEELGVELDAELVRMGVILHDAGKVLHPGELTGGGSQHEVDGERLLLELGVQPELARICRSHARWRVMPCSLEELSVALADKLWKGGRSDELERRFVELVARTSGREAWEVLVELDRCFEEIAAGGLDRLARSRQDGPGR